MVKRIVLLGLVGLVAVGCGAGAIDDSSAGDDDGGGTSNDGGGDGDGGGGGDHDGGASVDAGPGRDATVGDSPLVDPGCIDGQYSEVLPDLGVAISDLVAAFDAGQPSAFILAVLERRYPFGADLVELGAATGLGNCVTAFGYDLSTANAIINNFATIVHECGHFADLDAASGSTNVYYLATGRTLTLVGGDSTDRGGNTIARSRIRDDAFSAAHPACANFGEPDCDGYAPIYLDGNPDDGNFESGDQGFNLLLEETVQYVNSLASAYAYPDAMSPGSSTSARDGILTFLWYVERYLYLTRTEYASAYAYLLEGDGGRWRDAILTVWGRAWLYLELTRDIPALGIDDAFLEDLVTDPVLLGEIQRLRDAADCP